MITLKGIPKSTNHLYKSHCRFGYPQVYITAVGKDLKEDYQWQAKTQCKKITEKDLEVWIQIYRAKNVGDIDNFNKILFDSLTGIVWKDDKQIKKLHIELFTDRKDPRIEVDYCELP